MYTSSCLGHQAAGFLVPSNLSHTPFLLGLLQSTFDAGTTLNTCPSMKPIESEIAPRFNFQRVWYRALRYWYWIALSLVMALSIGFLNNRYAEKVYSVQASIIIKESDEIGETAELLYSNPLINSYRTSVHLS